MFVPVRADGPEVFSPRRHEDHEGLLHVGAYGPAMKGFWRGPVHGAGKPLWRLPVHRDRASDILPWLTRSPAANTAPRLSRSFLLRVLRAFVVENSGGRVRTPEYALGEPAVWAGAGGWAGGFFTTKARRSRRVAARWCLRSRYERLLAWACSRRGQASLAPPCTSRPSVRYTAVADPITRREYGPPICHGHSFFVSFVPSW